MPTIDRPEPPYLQIARRIREDITSGRLAEGDLVPSARQIVSSYGVAIGTASKALKALHAEGLTEVIPSVGTVVRSKALYRSARERTMSVLLTGKIYPEGHYAKIVSAGLVDATERITEALGLEAATSVIRRQRTTYDAEGQPVSVSVSWFDGALAEIAPLLLEPERILEGTARYVENCTGRTRSPREKLRLRAGAATAEEAEELQVPEGSPVMRGRNWCWDTEGDVIEYGESAAGEDIESNFEYDVEEQS